MEALALVGFALLWLGLLYGLKSLIAGRWKKVEVPRAAVYFLTVGMIGVFGEILLDTVYKAVIGHPLWRYNILPIHQAYTSAYAPIVWGIYGFHLYLLHDTLGSRWLITRTRHLALIFCVEALLLEAALTLSASWLLGQLMYYYYPPDLWHVSTFQNVPFYFVCGLVILKAMKRFRSDPLFFSAMSASLTVVVVFLT